MKRFVHEGHPDGQPWLLPPSIDEFVGQDAPVRLFSETMERLDVMAKLRNACKGGGRPAYDPGDLLKVYVFGMMLGIKSSRQLEEALRHDLRFMFLAGLARPDYRTLARFRHDREAEIIDAFSSTVKVGRQVGAIVGERICVDGTKLIANARKRACRSKPELQVEIDRADRRAKELLTEMDINDAEESENDPDGRGGRLPIELRDAKRRKEKLDEAMKMLEKRDRIVITDPDSRMIKTNQGIRPAYNAQAVVDAEQQMIVAACVCQDEADNSQLAPMLDKATETLGGQATEVLADGGYWSKESLDYVREHKVNAYIAASGVSAQQAEERSELVHDENSDTFTSPSGVVYRFEKERNQGKRRYRVYRSQETGKAVWMRTDVAQYHEMRAKVCTEEGKRIYARRKAIIEPVFGHLKGRFRLERLLTRGLSGARTEFLLGCIAHNVGKLMMHARAANLAVS